MMGASMPPMTKPLIGVGGYVTGTFITPAVLPFLDRICQSVGACTELALTSSNLAPSGRMKSKTPCLPEFLPVAKVGQAGDVTGGIVDSSGP